MIDCSKLPKKPFLSNKTEFAYEAHMITREKVFNEIFGLSFPANKIIIPNDGNLLLNWPGGGVFQYEPKESRNGWHNVTHGLSQPDNPKLKTEKNEDACSGFGIEFVISTPDLNNWAPNVLLNLVKYLLFQKTSKIIYPYHRLPCNGPIVTDTDTQITHLLAVPSPEYENEIQLPAGFCELVHMVGITKNEFNYAVNWGSGTGGSIILFEALQRLNVGTLTDPARTCITDMDDFQSIWDELQIKLEAKWKENGWDGEK